jgi:hypothetical protein
MQFNGTEGCFGGAPQYIQSRVWEGFSTAAKQIFMAKAHDNLQAYRPPEKMVRPNEMTFAKCPSYSRSY